MKKTNCRGISLTELVIAMGLSTLILCGLYSSVTTFLNVSRQLELEIEKFQLKNFLKNTFQLPLLNSGSLGCRRQGQGALVNVDGLLQAEPIEMVSLDTLKRRSFLANYVMHPTAALLRLHLVHLQQPIVKWDCKQQQFWLKSDPSWTKGDVLAISNCQHAFLATVRNITQSHNLTQVDFDSEDLRCDINFTNLSAGQYETQVYGLAKLKVKQSTSGLFSLYRFSSIHQAEQILNNVLNWSLDLKEGADNSIGQLFLSMNVQVISLQRISAQKNSGTNLSLWFPLF